MIFILKYFYKKHIVFWKCSNAGLGGITVYQMLIVDDDPVIRNGLKQLSIWKKLNIEIWGEAADGEEALCLLEKKAVDIILTDVKMPQMDGITFASRIKKKFPKIKIAFMSGYDDVAYLKSALKISAYDYIFKPIDLEELTSCCLRIASELDHEHAIQNKMNNLLNRFQIGTTFVRQNLISSILLDDGITKEIIQEIISASELPFLNKLFYVIAIKAIPNEILFQNGIQNILEKFQNPQEEYYIVNLNRENYIYAFICITENHLSSSELQNRSQKIISTLKTNGYKKVAVSFQPYEHDLSIYHIRQNCDTAVEMLKNWFYKGDESIITQNSKEEKEFIPEFFLNLEETEKILRETNHLEDYLKQFFNRLYESQKTNPLFYLNCLNDVLSLINTILQRNYQISEEDGLSSQNIFRTLASQLCLEDMEQIFKEYCINISNLLTQDQAKMKQSISKACNFIQKNYKQHLTVQKIAETVYLSSNYFCILFRKTTGMTVNNYIFMVRMEKAKELLGDNKYKLYDVSIEVGYENPSYFSRQFKKYTGLTPSEYRNQRTGISL